MSIGIIRGDVFVETTAKEVIHVNDIQGTSNNLKELKRDGGGVRLSTFHLW
jgi:hypothetical protein